MVHVDGDEDDPSDYVSIYDAVMDVEDYGFRVIVVHERDDAPYAQGVWVDAGKTIALLAAEGESPVLQGTLGNPSLGIHDTETALYVDGLGFMGNTGGLGLEANDALVWLDRSRVVQNLDGGILAQNGASLTLRNCFVGGGVDVVGVDIVGASADILYSTIGMATLAPMPTPSLRCTNPLEVGIRNSIVVSYGGLAGTELDCAGGVVTHSVTEEGDDIDFSGWFADFNSGAFWLTNAGAEALFGIAQWQAGDPETDIDGYSRPTTNAADYPGADRPPS